jgi:hypothetical protein
MRLLGCLRDVQAGTRIGKWQLCAAKGKEHCNNYKICTPASSTALTPSKDQLPEVQLQLAKLREAAAAVRV